MALNCDSPGVCIPRDEDHVPIFSKKQVIDRKIIRFCHQSTCTVLYSLPKGQR